MIYWSRSTSFSNTRCYFLTALSSSSLFTISSNITSLRLSNSLRVSFCSNLASNAFFFSKCNSSCTSFNSCVLRSSRCYVSRFIFRSSLLSRFTSAFKFYTSNLLSLFRSSMVLLISFHPRSYLHRLSFTISSPMRFTSAYNSATLYSALSFYYLVACSSSIECYLNVSSCRFRSWISSTYYVFKSLRLFVLAESFRIYNILMVLFYFSILPSNTIFS